MRRSGIRIRREEALLRAVRCVPGMLEDRARHGGQRLFVANAFLLAASVVPPLLADFVGALSPPSRQMVIATSHVAALHCDAAAPPSLSPFRP